VGAKSTGIALVTTSIFDAAGRKKKKTKITYCARGENDSKRVMNRKWAIKDISDQSGKVVIVTGANSGLGFASAKAMAEKEQVRIHTTQ